MADDEVVLTPEQALSLLRRTTDENWLRGMLSDPNGAAIIAAGSAVMSEASETVDEQVAACKISEAPTGRCGTCDLVVRRSNSSAPIRVAKGMSFVDARGVRLLLQSDVDVGVGQDEFRLPLVALRQIDLANTTTPVFSGQLEPGDPISAVVDGPPDEEYPTLGTYRFRVTAPSALSVPAYFDLALAPARFWDVVGVDGTDIRVTRIDGVRVPVDVSGFDRGSRTGSLFFGASGVAVYHVYAGVASAPDDALFGASLVWQDGEVAVYHLENLDDSSPAGNPLGAPSPPSSVPGKLGSAMRFDGVDDCIVAADSASLRPSALSLAVWFRPDGVPSLDTYYRRLISKPYEDTLVAPYLSFGLIFDAAGTHIAAVHSDHLGNPTGASARSGFTVGAWNHIVMTFDGGTLRIYLDGVLQAQEAGHGPVVYGTGSLLAGRTFPGTAFGRFQGDIDEVRLYQRALSDDEIADMYAGQSDPSAVWTIDPSDSDIGQAVYVSSTPIVGATADWLSPLGDERACHRQPNESGEAYRARVRQIPDAVTPKAIQEAVHGAEAILPTVYMVEPMRDQASDDARAALALVFADSPFCDDGYLDDPMGVDVAGKRPFRTCEMPSVREGRAYFRLAIDGEARETDGSILYLDDGFLDDPAWGYPDRPTHPDLVAAFRGIYDSARTRVAGGCQFDTYLECVERLDAMGDGHLFSTFVAFALSAPSGKAWLLRDGLVTATVNGEAVNPGLEGYWFFLVLSDGTTISTPTSRACDGMPLRQCELARLGYRNQPVSQIGVVTQSYAAALRAIGTFWVTPVTL